jgi:hypothetical protein
MNLTENARKWLAFGEKGISSEVMFGAISGLQITDSKTQHPLDPDDFKRCCYLIRDVPEWETELHKVAELSPVWKNIIDNWDKLVGMLLEQLTTHRANDMYGFMRSLGC